MPMKEQDWSIEPDVPVAPKFPQKVNARTKKAAPKGFVGGVVIWCSTCGSYKKVTDESTYDSMCPDCGNPMLIMRCNRCGHIWWMRNPQSIPTSCPGCHSPYWCRERTRP